MHEKKIHNVVVVDFRSKTTWYTKKQDGKSTVQNSGVTVVAMSGNEDIVMSYYGWIEKIWELDFMKFRIPLFLCK
jgi:hypothetical protein